MTAPRPTVGDPIPNWEMAEVSETRMQLLAAILRDPNPIHWDRDEVDARGLGRRLINQGPTNVGYVVNALLDWAGAGSLKKLRVRFTSNVFDGESLTAGGEVTGIRSVDGETLIDCSIALWHSDGRTAVEGEATVTWNTDDRQHEPQPARKGSPDGSE
jgi:acyl dehydratase